MRFLLITCFCLFGIVMNGMAQKAEKANTKQRGDNSYEPFNTKEMKAPSKKASRKKAKSYRANYYKTLEDTKKEFAERMEANSKKYRKMQKGMQKPQYSDPSYFGHKTKPKKRKPGKRKFCKECGIVH